MTIKQQSNCSASNCAIGHGVVIHSGFFNVLFNGTALLVNNPYIAHLPQKLMTMNHLTT